MSDFKFNKMSLEVKKVQNSDTYTDDSSGSDFFKTMLIFFENQMFCDVTLISANADLKLKAHRIVLSASSVYFRAMFGGSLKEADAAEVNFDQFDEHTLKSVITYIYAKSIELHNDTVENIIKAAHLFQLETLEVACCDHLTKQLDPCNCLGIALFAKKYDYTKLYAIAFAFALENFMKLRSVGEFFALDADQLSSLLSSNELRVPSEEVVFNSLKSWIEYDNGNRQKCLAQLLRRVRFGLLRPTFIKASIEPAIRDNLSDCQDLIYEAYKMHLFAPVEPTSHSEEQISLRSLKDVIIAISGWDSNETERVLSVGLYFDGFDEWIYKKWPGPPVNRCGGFGVAVLGEKLIIAGGSSPIAGTISNRVDCLNLRTLEWTSLSPLLAARHSFAMAVLNGCIYAVGGCNANGALLTSVERYDPKTEKWQLISHLSVPCPNPLVAIKTDSLCVAVNINKSVYENGRNVNKNVRQLYSYNPKTNQWAEWIESKLDLIGIVTLPLNGVDYFTEVSKTEITSIDLQDNTTTKTPSTIDFDATNAAVFGNRIVVHNERVFKQRAELGTWKNMPILRNDRGRVVLISQ